MKECKNIWIKLFLYCDESSFESGWKAALELVIEWCNEYKTSTVIRSFAQQEINQEVEDGKK